MSLPKILKDVTDKLDDFPQLLQQMRDLVGQLTQAMQTIGQYGDRLAKIEAQLDELLKPLPATELTSARGVVMATDDEQFNRIEAKLDELLGLTEDETQAPVEPAHAPAPTATPKGKTDKPDKEAKP